MAAVLSVQVRRWRPLPSDIASTMISPAMLVGFPPKSITRFPPPVFLVVVVSQIYTFYAVLNSIKLFELPFTFRVFYVSNGAITSVPLFTLGQKAREGRLLL